MPKLECAEGMGAVDAEGERARRRHVEGHVSGAPETETRVSVRERAMRGRAGWSPQKEVAGRNRHWVGGRNRPGVGGRNRRQLCGEAQGGPCGAWSRPGVASQPECGAAGRMRNRMRRMARIRHRASRRIRRGAERSRLSDPTRGSDGEGGRPERERNAVSTQRARAATFGVKRQRATAAVKRHRIVTVVPARCCCGCFGSPGCVFEAHTLAREVKSRVARGLARGVESLQGGVDIALADPLSSLAASNIVIPLWRVGSSIRLVPAEVAWTLHPTEVGDGKKSMRTRNFGRRGRGRGRG
eukprot:2183327-Rhodomonas_salina.2